MKSNEISIKARKKDSARRRRNFSRRLLPALIAGCFACGPVYANPTGAQVVAGHATIVSNGNTLTITNTPGSILNWTSFSIGTGEVTQFLQQNSSSAVLNRIIGQNPTQIFGTLESNGKVFLINPNGILFEPGSQVNVGGLVASSLDISNTDFIAGKNNFTSTVSAPGSVVNQGSITTPSGGSIYLIAPQVQNSGVLTSPQGEILLAAGHSVQLVDGADPNIQVVISSGADEALNLGQVIAQGGKVGIYGALVNQNGTVNADSAVVGENGVVVFKSSQTTTLGANSVTSAVGQGTGGTVEVLGPDVAIIDNALINASGQSGGGKVMVGGDFHGANPAIPDSTDVFVSSAANIKADAIQSGNGGKVAVWSENSTEFYGNISALGGALSGNGGYVETSGKLHLDFDGFVDLKAPYGSTGTLLLDPASLYVVTIDNSGNNPQLSPSGNYYSGSAQSYVSANTLSTQLASSNILIETGAATGDILVNADVSWTTVNTLSLLASGNITLNANIFANATGASGGAPKGGLSLNATNGNITQTAGIISAATLTAVANTTGGSGNVSLTNYNAVSRIAGYAQGIGGFQFKNSSALTVSSLPGYSGGVPVGSINGISAAAGNILLQTNAGNIAVNAPLTATNSTVSIKSAANITESGAGSIVANSLYLSAPGGYVNLGSNSNNISGTIAGQSNGNFTFVNSGSFSIGGNLYATSGISSTTGNISLTSTTGSINSNGNGPISGALLTMSAYAGIGTTGALNTAVSTLSVTNGLVGSGGGIINISNNSATSGPLTLNGIYQKNSGTSSPIIITNNGNITTTYEFSVSTPSGNIGLFATSGNIAINGNVSASNGSIGISANAGNISITAPVTASNTISLSASGSIYQPFSCATDAGCALQAGSMSAISSGGYVSLTNPSNNVGTIAGSAAGSGFSFTGFNGFTVGVVNSIGSSYSATTSTVNGISSTGGPIALNSGNGNITVASPINANNNEIDLTATSSFGSIVQNSGGLITTSGLLYMNVTGSVGASGANNSLSTNVGELRVTAENDVYISNSSNALQLDQAVAPNGNVNISTTGSLTLPAATSGDCNFPCYPTNYSGTSMTLVSGGNLDIGSHNTIATYQNVGAISLYAGFTESPGSAPVTNATVATMALNGSFSGTSIDLWANSYSDFSNQSGTTFSTTPTYHPGPNPWVLTVTGTTVADKTFDGTNYAMLSNGVLSGAPADYLSYVTLNQRGTFSTLNVQNGPITVNANDTLNIPAAFAGDFVLNTQPTGLSAMITPLALSVSGQTATGKIYDGKANVATSGGILSLASDTISGVSLNQIANLPSKNVGSYSFAASDTLTIPATYTANDFSLTQPILTASVSPASLTLSGVSVNNKPYDTTTNATFSGGTLSGLVPADSTSVSFLATGAFKSAAIGTNIEVPTNFSLIGSGAGNYTLTPTSATLYANITEPASTNIPITPGALSQTPVVFVAIDNYIVGLNISTSNVTGAGKPGDANAGGSGSGYTFTFDKETNKGDKESKLYCTSSL